MLLNHDWHEQQYRRAYVQKMARQRKQELQSMEADDGRLGRGSPATLTHPSHEEKFRGRLYEEEGGGATFVEELTWIRVSVKVPASDKATRGTTNKREVMLYNEMRAAHAKAKDKASLAARQEAMKAQLPKAPGEMTVKGKTNDGKLTCTWEGVEVNVTPGRADRHWTTEPAP